MSKIPLLGHRKESALKYRASMDKENAYSVVQNGKSFEGKNDGGKKKGLSLNAENRAVFTSTPIFSVGKAKFQIYSENNDENVRSRPRVRKDVCRKEIRARRDSKELEKTIVSTMKLAEINNLDSRVVSRRRARSSSNSRHVVPLDKTIEMNNKLFHNRRAYSESRKISPQWSHYAVQPSDGRKIRHLTDDVKKRTFSSIQMWKDKMRKPHTGAVPKNIAANVLNVDKTRVKTKPRKNSVTGPSDFQSEVLLNRTTDPNENIEQPAAKVNALTDVLRFLSNEIAVILEDKPRLKVQADISTRNFISNNKNNNLSIMIDVISSTVTPFDGPSFLPLTPTKVRYEKHVTGKLSVSQEKELDVLCEMTMYVRDYLEDVPDTERKKENNAPRLSHFFLRKNVNAEQRRLIVGYIVRLGVHNHYFSNVIYQTIKLFDVAIDRIVVQTNDIQLLALACLWITLKREAPVDKIPSVIRLFVQRLKRRNATIILQLAKDLYINQEKVLLMYEKKILSEVKFNIQFADPFSLLSYYILNINRDSQYNIITPNNVARIYFCGCYMIDLSMLDENLCGIPALVIAIAAVELSLRFASDVQVWCQIWRSKQSLTEWEEREVNSTKRVMIQHALEFDNFSSKIIYKKYMCGRYGNVTNFLHDKLNTTTI